MKRNKATAETLNDLVQINNDRIVGYENALKELDADDAGLRSLFLEMIDQSHRFKIQLGTEIEVLGSDIDSGTSTSGKIHRAWLNLKATFSGHNEKSILEECEFGEDAILKAYDSALAEEHVPSYIKDILREQQGYLMEAHDEIKSLRDSA
ncbi:MAG: family four-helix-bundle protein [Mucilaginibacter sp.]|nr:family four-helix-bundle protein [Mucilaginibacter sp.]